MNELDSKFYPKVVISFVPRVPSYLYFREFSAESWMIVCLFLSDPALSRRWTPSLFTDSILLKLKCLTLSEFKMFLAEFGRDSETQ